MDLPIYVAACDVSMVIFADYPILEHNSANKFFDSLSAGKPILLNYSGWQRDIIENNNAGYGCGLYDIEQFVEKVLYLYNCRTTVVKMGKNARKLAERYFDRDTLATKVLCILSDIVETNYQRKQAQYA